MYLFSNFRAVFELFIFISKVSSFKTVKTGKDYLNFYQRFVDNFQVTDLTIFGFLLCSKIGFSPIIFLSKIRKVSHHSRLQLKNGSSKRNHRGLRTQLVALFCTSPNLKLFLTMCGWVGFPDAPAGAKLSSLSLSSLCSSCSRALLYNRKCCCWDKIGGKKRRFARVLCAPQASLLKLPLLHCATLLELTPKVFLNLWGK